jgi:hypothetical protein
LSKEKIHLEYVQKWNPDDCSDSNPVKGKLRNPKIKACDRDESLLGRNSLRPKTKVNEYFVERNAYFGVFGGCILMVFA